MKVVIFTACVACVFLCGERELWADGGRPWTVNDSVAVRYFMMDPAKDDFPSTGYASQKHPVIIAPDGRHFLFMTFHQDVRTDTTTDDLYVYSVSDVERLLADSHPETLAKPERFVTFRGAHRSSDSDDGGADGIDTPVWENADSVLFLARQGRAPRRVYRLTVSTGIVRPLTGAQYDVPSYAFSDGFPIVRNESVLFSRFIATSVPVGPLDRYPMAAVTGDDVRKELFPEYRAANFFALYATYHGATRFVAAAPPPILMQSLSPNGRWAVLVAAIKGTRMPAAWSGYEEPPSDATQFLLIDMKTGHVRSMVNAPVGPVPTGLGVIEAVKGWLFHVVWSMDSRHVILTDTRLPITQPDRRSMSYIIDYDVRTGKYSIVEPFVNSKLSFTHYREGKFPDGLTVAIRENANDPPVMVASNDRNEITLTGPDPALRGVWRAHVTTIHWRDPDGSVPTGLLMLPRNYVNGVPIPLVIEDNAAAVDDTRFLPDGTLFNAMAAQPLAAQGFAVLQIAIPGHDVHDSPAVSAARRSTTAEASAYVARIDAAVDMLAAAHIADATRVGLIGFSRSGYMNTYLITHPGHTKIAAVIADDSTDGGYYDYVTDFALDGKLHYGGTYWGGFDSSKASPDYPHGEPVSFWANKTAWLDNTGFNVDRVKTPMLYTLHEHGKNGGPASIIYMFERIGAFRALHRPMEFLVFPMSGHSPELAQERAALMQASVDWMNFWLQSKMPADPERATRWKHMRADWIQTQKNEQHV